MLTPLEFPTIGARVRELREDEGVSLRKLARRAGISRSALSKIERGDVVPSVGSLERLAVGLGMSLTALWPGDDVDAIEQRGAGWEVATADGARPKRVLAGEGMLKVVRSFRYEGENFEAPRGTRTQRVHPSHPACRAFPFHFEPAYAKDRTSGVLQFLESRRRGKLGSAARPSWYLGDSRLSRTDWRLR